LYQKKPYIALTGEGRLRLGIAQASLALHSACTALDAGDPRVNKGVVTSLVGERLRVAKILEWPRKSVIIRAILVFINSLKFVIRLAKINSNIEFPVQKYKK